MNVDEKLRAICAEQPYPLLFASLSGAHLYGFPSRDSDYDLRGVHLLPAAEVLGLRAPRETIEAMEERDGLELDLVTHDLLKFLRLMLKPNGYVLEQLYSPLVIHSTPEHAELQALAEDCVTRHHAHHYLGFASSQWKLFRKEDPPRIKPLLYGYRVLLTGIHLMRTGKVEANLIALNGEFRLSFLDELIRAKTESEEKCTLADADLEFHTREFERLQHVLEDAHRHSQLPEAPRSPSALDEFLVRLRLP